VSTAVGQAKGINRADLLRTLVQAGEATLHMTAEMTGFVPPVKRKVTLKIPSIPTDEAFGKPGGRAQPKPHPKTQPAKQAHYYRVIERKASELLHESTGQVSLIPEWYEKAPPLNQDEIKPLPVQPPEKEPLVAWAKLWPLLRTQLSEVRYARQPDIPRIVKVLAKGELLHSIPRQYRQQWTATVQILVDRPERTCLFNQDYNQLLEQLKHLRGVIGLEIETLVRQPGGPVRVKKGDKMQVRDWHPPLAGTTVFILSDLGRLDESGLAWRAWLHVGRQLRLAGCRPVAFVPLPARYLTAELIGLFGCISWDRGSSLQPVAYVPPRGETDTPPMQQDAEAGAKRLLAWLSPVVRVEPALLRAVRHHLPVHTADVGTEAAAWHHEDVVRSPIGFHFQPKTLEDYRQRFAAQAKADPLLAQSIAATIRAYHQHVFPTQRYEELLILAHLLGNRLEKTDWQEVEVARNHMRQLVKASQVQQEAIPSLPGFIQQNYFSRQHADMFPDNDFLQAIWSLRHREQGITGELAIPDGWDIKRNVLPFLGWQATTVRDYVLFQQGMQVLRVATRQHYDAEQEGFTVGSPLAEFRSVSSYLLNQHIGVEGKTRSVLLPLDDTETRFLPLAEEERQQLHMAGEELVIERFLKPTWAVSIGRNHSALTVTTLSAAGRPIWCWYPPQWQTESGMFPGFWYYLPPDKDSLKPDWATAAGRDGFGLYAEAVIAGITQRFRWIEPTSFLMGSPENENGRYDNEIQHPVTLTQGYWLADTACTQALWQTVMDRNPSAFKGENNPVENVSWDDIEKFLQRLNRQYPELKLRLPTEAEWENACRAGTIGAFNFEGELLLDKINYRGTWEDYSNWGESALQQTAVVKSYPPNAWGLYEMHGNVWEWCQDWYGDYPTEPVVDPLGAESGARRVLRGGSWFFGGESCRSAYRLHYPPDFVIGLVYYGFRLARGLELSGRPGASQQPVGTPAPARGGHKRGMAGGGGAPAQKPARSSTGKNKNLLDVIKDSIKDKFKQ
jgi:formylglycine-generating enzyme required for sulfatase activity